MNSSVLLEEDITSVLIVAIIMAGIVWYNSGMAGTLRITNTLMAGLITAAVMAVGLWMLN